MGIKLYVDAYGNKDAYIIMDIQSILAFIDAKMTYPSRQTWVDGKYMITHVWKDAGSPDAIKPPEGAIVLTKEKK